MSKTWWDMETSAKAETVSIIGFSESGKKISIDLKEGSYRLRRSMAMHIVNKLIVADGGITE